MAYTVEDIQKVLGTTENYYTPKERPMPDPEKNRYSVEDIEAVVGKSTSAGTPQVSSSANATKSATGRKASAINKRKTYSREAEERLERFSRLRRVDDLEGTNAPIAADLLPLMDSDKSSQIAQKKKGDTATKKKDHVISKTAKKVVTKAFEGPKSFEEAKQGKGSQNSIANKPYRDVSEHVPSLEELMAKESSTKSLVEPKAKGKPKKKQASTYLSGDMQPSGGVPAAAKKQADSSVPKRQALKEFDAALLEQYISPDYVMDSREKAGARKYIKDYYRTENSFLSNIGKNKKEWDDEALARYEQILALDNKTRAGAAAMMGAVDALGLSSATKGLNEAIKKFAGEDSEVVTETEKQIANMDKEIASAKKQNPLESMAGQMAGQVAKYAATKKMLGGIPGYDKLNQKVAGKLGKYGQNVADVLADTTVDAVAETIPQMIGNAQSGMGAGEVAAEAGKNLAQNLKWNVLGEAFDIGLKKLPEMRKLGNGVDAKIPEAKPVELGNFGTLSAADEADLLALARKLPPVGETTGKLASDALTGASGTMSNKHINDIISNPAARKEFEQVTGHKLTGTKAEMRKKVNNVMVEQQKRNITDPVEKALLDPNVGNTHTAEQMQQMQDYLKSSDRRIIDYANEVRSAGTKGYVKPIQISTVGERSAEDIKRLTGLDVRGNKVVLDKNAIEHIDKRHGVSGTADHSMADDETLARIAYVLNNYDSVELGNSAKGTRLANGEYAPTVVFSKKVDGTYYTVEAVTDAKTKTNRIVSAYVSKKEAYPVSHADSLPRTSTPKPELTSFDKSISNLSDNVNENGKTLALDTEDGANISSGIIGEDGNIYGDIFKSRTGENLMAKDGKKISKLRTNTFENSPDISNEALAEMDKSVDFTYSPLKTADANRIANERFKKSGKEEIRRLSTEQFKDSTDVKESMNLLTGRLNDEKLSIDDRNELARNLARNSREYGRGLQSLQEYSGTAEDSFAKAASFLNKKTEEMLDDNKKLAKEIENVAEELVNKVKEISVGRSLDDVEGGLPWNGEMTDVQKVVQDILNKSSFHKKVDDDAVSRIVDMLENQKDTTEIFDELSTYVANGIFGISDKVWKEVDDLFAEADKYGEYSKQRSDLISQAYAKLADEVATSSLMDKWDAWRYLAMLGNTRTHLRNFVGNKMFGAVTNIKDKVAALMEGTVDKASQITRGYGIERTKSFYLGKEGRELLKAGKRDAVDNVYTLLNDGHKYSNAYSGIESEKKIFSGAFSPLEKLRKFNSDMLDKEDFLALKSKYARALAGYLKANGADANIFKNTDALSQKLLENARSYAIREAQEATFHEANKAAEILSRFSKELKEGGVGGKAGYMVMEGLLPFKKTPLNIVREGVRYSPVSLIKGITDLITEVPKGKKNAAEVIDELAKGLTGSGILALGGLLSSWGILKSSGDSDDNMNYYESGIGKQNYSIQVGDHNYTIDWTAPAALPLFVGAELFKAMERQGSTLDTFFDSLTNITEPILETTMLSGLNDTLDTISKSGSEDMPGGRIAAVAGTTMSSYATQGIPTLFGQVARSLDGTRRDTYADQTGFAGSVDKAMNKIQNKIPFLSEKNEAYIDHWGNEEKHPGGNVLGRLAYNMLSPGYYANTSEMTKVDEEIQRLYQATGNASVAPSSYVTNVTVGGVKTRLSEKEHEAIARDMGTTQYQILDELIKNPFYESMSDEDKAEVITQVYGVAKDVAASKNIDGFESNKALFKAYQKGGVDGVVSYICLNNAANQFKNKDGSERSFGQANNHEKIKVMEQQEMSPSEMGEYLYSPDMAKGAKSAYSEYGYEGVYDYYKIKEEANTDGKGSVKKDDELIPYLNDSDFTQEEKRYYFSLFFPRSDNPY